MVRVMTDGVAIGPILMGVDQPAHILTPAIDAAPRGQHDRDRRGRSADPEGQRGGAAPLPRQRAFAARSPLFVGAAYSRELPLKPRSHPKTDTGQSIHQSCANRIHHDIPGHAQLVLVAPQRMIVICRAPDPAHIGT